MTMLEERPTAPIPLEQAIAELDSPEAIADRRKRAKQMALKVEGDARDDLINSASREALERAFSPRKRGNQWERPSESEKRSIERQVTENFDALVVKLAEEELRRRDERALYADPRRLREQRVWNSYTSQVSAMAWRQGNQSDEWVRCWRQLIADRAAASSYGDPVGAIDARLRQHVGVDYPQMPQAAWAAVETIPGAAEREAELQALEELYPGTRPGTPTTDAPTRRRARK